MHLPFGMTKDKLLKDYTEFTKTTRDLRGDIDGMQATRARTMTISEALAHPSEGLESTFIMKPVSVSAFCRIWKHDFLGIIPSDTRDMV